MQKIIPTNNIFPPNWNFLSLILENPPIENKKNNLLIYVLTWNIHGKLPQESDLQIILPKDKHYDIYIINTQECLRSISASFLNDSKDEWINLLSTYFGSDYYNLANENLSAFHISIFVHYSIKNDFSQIRRGNIKTGFMNMIANKGAVAISFKYLNKNYLFINCHLTAGQEETEGRNNDFKRINTKLNLEPYFLKNNSENYLSENISSLQPSLTISDNFDIVIWSGDFNYRLETNEKFTLKKLLQCIKDKDYDELIKHDQLKNEIKSNKFSFYNFDEGDIFFPPTYKYEENSDEYYLKERTPGWTDRILFYSKNFTDLILCKYNCYMKTKTSDHKPVYAIFKIDMSDLNKENIDNEKYESKICNIF